MCGTPDQPFPVRVVAAKDLPPAKDTKQVCGKDASGCRLAFDLGKSDIKTVAVKDNEALHGRAFSRPVATPGGPVALRGSLIIPEWFFVLGGRIRSHFGSIFRIESREAPAGTHRKRRSLPLQRPP